MSPEAARALELPGAHVADEVDAAVADLWRDESQFLQMPWPSLARVIGGMAGGEVCSIGAFSGMGKTTFLSTLTDLLYERGRDKIYYMGLESRPKTLRTHWACKRLGYDAGAILTGGYLTRQDWPLIRERIVAELKSQARGDKLERVRFCPTPIVTEQGLRRAAAEAHDFGATVFIIDHVDHLNASGASSLYAQSVAVSKATLELAQKFGFLMFPATQFNNDAVRGSRILVHTAPTPNVVKNGGHKREDASWQLGLYKPLKLFGRDKQALERFNATGEGYEDVIERDCMAVSVMKHRHYGSREGKRVLLRVTNGRVEEPGQFDFLDPRNP